MLDFDAGHGRAILAFVATGHVLFVDAAGREPIACLDVGEQAHAAFPASDGSYVIVANQNGKLLQRIATDYTTDTYALDEAATLNLATCTTPSGAACEDPNLRPDNAPICPIIEGGSRFAAVTQRGGGLFVVDSTATPMAIVAEYDLATIRPNGCGGLETGGTKLTPYAADLYAFDLAAFSPRPSAPNTPAPRTIFSMDVSPDGAWVFLALRGPKPLTASVEGVDNAVGVSPGLGVVRVVGDGRTGGLVGLAPISHAGEGGEIADPHGLRVRRT